MSEQLTSDAGQPTAISVLPARAISTIIAADTNDILGKLAAKVAAFKPDVSTPKGRKEIASLAAEVASSKMDLIRLGKSLTEGWRKSTSAVNAECKVIEERMDALKVQVREKLTVWEDLEKARVQAHEEALAAIVEGDAYGQTETAMELEQRLDWLFNYPNRDWQEFNDRFNETMEREIRRTKALHGAAVRREAEAAELTRLRAEEAERQRLEALRVQQEREAEIARQAAEQARLAAETEAERLRIAAEEAAAKALREAGDRAEAERLAIERRAQEEAAAAENARLAAIAEGERLVREAEERAADAAAQVERDRQAEEDRAAQALRVAAEREAAQTARAEEAERQAEAARQQAARDAEVAVERERKRAEAEAERVRQETIKREADKKHRAKINNEILDDFLLSGLSEETAKIVIMVIAKGLISHTRIIY